MTFIDFVTTYWKKLRRSGLPWTAVQIVEDSGLRTDVVQVYLDWLSKQPDDTDAGLAAKFDSSVMLKITPFGAWLIPHDAPPAPDTIGQMSTDQFWAQLRTLIGTH